MQLHGIFFTLMTLRTNFTTVTTAPIYHRWYKEIFSKLHSVSLNYFAALKLNYVLYLQMSVMDKRGLLNEQRLSGEPVKKKL
jgi:leucyl-tRNA synthetase